MRHATFRLLIAMLCAAPPMAQAEAGHVLQLGRATLTAPSGCRPFRQEPSFLNCRLTRDDGVLLASLDDYAGAAQVAGTAKAVELQTEDIFQMSLALFVRDSTTGGEQMTTTVTRVPTAARPKGTGRCAAYTFDHFTPDGATRVREQGLFCATYRPKSQEVRIDIAAVAVVRPARLGRQALPAFDAEARSILATFALN